MEESLDRQAPRSLVAQTFARLFFKRATVAGNEAVADGFRLLTLHTPFDDARHWPPGQVLHLRVGAFQSRTYTLIPAGPEGGDLRFLAFLHGHGPGSDWAASARPGAACEFRLPQRSMNLERFGDALLVFGDETSFGLAAAATRAGIATRCIFEVDDVPRAAQALAAIGVRDASLFARSAGHGHLAQAAQVLREAAAGPCTFVLTGQAASIQQMHRVLKSEGLPAARIRTQAYWAPGKTGMD